MLRRSLLAMATAATAAAPGVRAQTGEGWPQRTITLVVPSAPGGTLDALARFFAQAMSPKLGRSVVVENASGAGGLIGMQRAARAEPDGHTLVFGNMGVMAASVAVNPDPGYDPRRDLAPVGLAAHVPMVLAASPQSGVRDLQALLARIRERRDAATFGTAGLGTTSHLAPAMLLHLTGLKATLVSYRGAGPAMNDLAAGVVDAVIDQTVTMIPAHRGRTAVALAVSGAQRVPQLPEVPTFAEVRAPDDDPPVRELRPVEGVERAAPDVHHVVRDVDDVRDRAHPREVEPRREATGGTGRRRRSGRPARCSAGSLEVVHANVDLTVAGRPAGPTGSGSRSSPSQSAATSRASPTIESRSDAVHRGRHIEHPVGERQHVGERGSRLEAVREQHDPVVVGAEADLVLGEDHPARDLAAQLPLRERAGKPGQECARETDRNRRARRRSSTRRRRSAAARGCRRRPGRAAACRRSDAGRPRDPADDEVPEVVALVGDAERRARGRPRATRGRRRAIGRRSRSRSRRTRAARRADALKTASRSGGRCARARADRETRAAAWRCARAPSRRRSPV